MTVPSYHPWKPGAAPGTLSPPETSRVDTVGVTAASYTSERLHEATPSTA